MSKFSEAASPEFLCELVMSLIERAVIHLALLNVTGFD